MILIYIIDHGIILTHTSTTGILRGSYISDDLLVSHVISQPVVAVEIGLTLVGTYHDLLKVPGRTKASVVVLHSDGGEVRRRQPFGI